VERTHYILKASEELGHFKKGEGSSSDDDSDVPEKIKKAAKNSNLPKEVLLHRARKKLLKIPNSCLYQISYQDLPQHKKQYGEVYKYLALQGMIPIGILRGILANLRVGPKANYLPYVFTNPPADTEIYACDKIFVLSITPVKMQNSGQSGGKMEMKDFLLNIQTNKRFAGSMLQTRPSALAQGLKNKPVVVKHSPDSQQFLLELTEKNFKKFDDKLKKLSTDVEGQLSTILHSLETLFQDSSDMNISDLFAGYFNSFKDDDTMSVQSDFSDSRPPSIHSSPVRTYGKSLDNARGIAYHDNNPDSNSNLRKPRSQSLDSPNPQSSSTFSTAPIPRRINVLEKKTTSPRNVVMQNNSTTKDESPRTQEKPLLSTITPRSSSYRKRSLSNPVDTIHEEPGDSSNPSHSEEDDEDRVNIAGKFHKRDNLEEKKEHEEEKVELPARFPVLLNVSKKEESTKSSPTKGAGGGDGSTIFVPNPIEYGISNASLESEMDNLENMDDTEEATSMNRTRPRSKSKEEEKYFSDDFDDNSTYVSFADSERGNSKAKISPVGIFLPAHKLYDGENNNNRKNSSNSYKNNNNDDDLSVRSFQSTTSKSVISKHNNDRITGPKLKDIAPLPLEKIMRLQQSSSSSSPMGKRFSPKHRPEIIIQKPPSPSSQG
jgi:hypothetical protein